jgi:large subunit ribosomal protein L5
MGKNRISYQPKLKVDINAAKQDLLEKMELTNINQLPRLKKVVVSVGLGKAKDDKKLIEVASNTLLKVTGQKPVSLMAKKSIATFKIRKGLNTIGVKVTLRGDIMYEFVERLLNIVLPRVRDFHGTTLKFDNNFNYSLGLVDQTVFPELSFEETTVAHGMQVTFVISGSKKKEHSMELLKFMGMPFERIKTGGSK